MTPGRLTELECPKCQKATWVIDSDYRGMDGVMLPYDERLYECLNCRHAGPGWKLGRQSPPEFLLQPHDLYPMKQATFDYWVDVLKAHFPYHPAITRIGTTFVPRLPEEAAARQAAHDHRYPVGEMKDQDGARRAEPRLKDVVDWIDMMQIGDILLLRRRDGGELKLTLDGSAYAATCFDPTGAVQAVAADLPRQMIEQVSRMYLNGDAAGCVRQLRFTK